MPQKHIVFILADIENAPTFEWIAAGLKDSDVRLSFIMMHPAPPVPTGEALIRQGVEVTYIQCAGKSGWPSALRKIYRYLRRTKPDGVHCHLIQANILGLLAAKLAKVPLRVYTRHHGTLHHIYHPKGVWWDKLCNALATRIVSISSAVTDILTKWEKVDPKKIVLIPHGFPLEYFAKVDGARIDAFRQRHDVPSDRKIVGVISRFTEWKGIQYILPAFKHLQEEFPEAYIMLLNAKGDYAAQLQLIFDTMPPSSYKCIEFEPDVASAYACMDYFVHTPVDEHSEAFGQTYVEALAAGIPSVFTNSGIAPEFIRDGENALLVPFRDADAIYEALRRLYTDPALCARLVAEGHVSVSNTFALANMVGRLHALYTGAV